MALESTQQRKAYSRTPAIRRAFSTSICMTLAAVSLSLTFLTNETTTTGTVNATTRATIASASVFQISPCSAEKTP